MAKIYLAIDGGGGEHVFTTWAACKYFVHGNPYRFCAAESLEAARIRLGLVPRPAPRKEQPPVASVTLKPNPGKSTRSQRPTEGLCSDAGTHGNPGPCEYQVTDLAGNLLKHEHLGHGTNNYAELRGILAAIELAQRQGVHCIWTDSQVCLNWIQTGRVGEGVARRQEVIYLIDRIRAQIRKGPAVDLRKWITRDWGEIPADFGRK